MPTALPGVVYVRTTGRNQDGESVLEYVRWVMVQEARQGEPGSGRGGAEAGGTGRSGHARRRRARDCGRALRLCPRRGPASLGRLCAGREDRPRRRHDPRGGRAPDRHSPLPEHRQGALQSARAGAGAVQAAAGLRRRGDLACPRACPSTASPTRSTSLPSTAGGMSRPASAATPSTRGRRCWRRPRFQTAATSARCACGWLAVKNRACADFPLRNAAGEYAEGVILDLDLWLVLPR